MAKHGEEVRDALVRQWQAITAAVASLDLETPSRAAGWRNRDVVAHLCLQPALLRKFIATAHAARRGHRRGGPGRDSLTGPAGRRLGTRSRRGGPGRFRQGR